ncbi:MAG: hypothetical protein ABI844_17075 [Saprospiraceae bacterium]
MFLKNKRNGAIHHIMDDGREIYEKYKHAADQRPVRVEIEI